MLATVRVWCSRASGRSVAGEGSCGATAHEFVALIVLCMVVAAVPGISIGSGRYPCCRAFGRGDGGTWLQQRGMAPRGGISLRRFFV
jgi:hypothetical protein